MSLNDPAQTDLAWRGYSGWAMLPSFFLCGLVSIALLTSGWFFEDIRGISQEVGSLVFFFIALGIWIGQLLRWLYRGATYIYRLTPARLYLDRGFLYNPEPAVELSKVIDVEWGCNALCRFFGVGFVVLHSEGREAVTLTGVLRPAAFAEEIREAVKNVKA
jgi:membrane protein YdbS with pleckstrin-like domain